MLSITKYDKRCALDAVNSVYRSGALPVEQWSQLVGVISSVQVGHPVAPLGPKVIDVIPSASEVAEPSSRLSRVERIVLKMREP